MCHPFVGRSYRQFFNGFLLNSSILQSSKLVSHFFPAINITMNDRSFSRKFCIVEDHQMELSNYRKLFSIHFWRRFSNYFSLELNRVNTITKPLEVFDDINLFTFGAFTLKIKMFEIVPIRQEFIFLLILGLRECLQTLCNTERTFQSNVRVVVTHQNILKSK